MSVGKREKVVCSIEMGNALLVWKREGTSKWRLPGGAVPDQADCFEAIFRLTLEQTDIDLSSSPVEYFGVLTPEAEQTPSRIHVFKQLRPAPPVLSARTVDRAQKYQYTPITLEVIHRLKESHKKAYLRSAQPPILSSPVLHRRIVITLLGTVGSGKGTHGSLLSTTLNLPALSIGDLFRKEIREKTPIGTLISQEIERQGKTAFLADEIALGILVKTISQPHCQKGFILDGFPRLPEQSKILVDGVLDSTDLHIPIYLFLKDSEIIQRISHRLICSSCGVQERDAEAQATTGECSKCGGVLTKRDEDSTESRIKERIAFSKDHLPSTITALTTKNSVAIVSTTGPKEDVFARIFSVVQEKIKTANAGTSQLSTLGAASIIRSNVYERMPRYFEYPLAIRSLYSLANDNFVIQNSRGKYVLHIPGPDTHFYVDYAAKFRNSQEAFSRGFSPIKITEIDGKSGIQTSEFIENLVEVPKESLVSDVGLEEVATLLKSIHSSSVELAGTFNPFKRLQQMMLLLGERAPEMAEPFIEISHEMSTFAELSSSPRFVALPCHNDPVPGNFVRTPQGMGTLQLIDWEFSGLGDPAWDLAFFSTINSLSDRQEQRLLAAYNSEDMPLLYAKVLFFKAVAYVTSSVWACLQLEEETPKIPHEILRQIVDEKAERYSALIKSQEFQEALELLKN